MLIDDPAFSHTIRRFRQNHENRFFSESKLLNSLRTEPEVPIVTSRYSALWKLKTIYALKYLILPRHKEYKPPIHAFFFVPASLFRLSAVNYVVYILQFLIPVACKRPGILLLFRRNDEQKRSCVFSYAIKFTTARITEPDELFRYPKNDPPG